MYATVIMNGMSFNFTSMKDARELAKVNAVAFDTNCYIIKGNDKYAYEYYDNHGKLHKSEVAL